MTNPASKILTAALERALPSGRWATVEQLVKETGYAETSLRTCLNRHPLADWRPAPDLSKERGAPVKEWTIFRAKPVPMNRQEGK